MKQFPLLLCFLILTQIPECFSQNNNDLTFERIYDLIIPMPEKAITLADSAEAMETIPTFKADIIRSRAYAKIKQEKLALKYALKAFQSDSVQNDSIRYMNVCAILSNCYVEMSQNKEAMEYAIKASKLAKELDNKQVEAKALITISRVQRELGQPEQGYKTQIKALEILKKSNDFKAKIQTCVIYIERVGMLITDQLYKEAVENGKLAEEVFCEIESIANPPIAEIDLRKGYLYSRLANAYQSCGYEKQAAIYYQKFLATNFSKKPEGKTQADKYLLLIKNYKQVIANTLERERLRPAQDTINRDYAITLAKLEDAYTAMGDYKTALQYEKKKSAIWKKIYERDKEDVALQLSIAYETQEKETQIARQTEELQHRNTLLTVSASIIILLFLLLWLTYRNNRIIKRKNKITVNQINQLISCRDQLQQARETIKELSISNIQSPAKETGSMTNEPADSDIFATLQEIITKEKLFLQPDLTREYLLKRIKTDKNRFARMLQENANSNFNSYINDMRLEYSMLLMKQYPHHTIQAIAQDSGISNVRTYHRLFKEKMGMTPAEYKAALSHT